MAKVTVRMLQGMAGPRIICRPCFTYSFEKSEAIRLVEHGVAEIIEPVKGAKPSETREQRVVAGKAAAP